MEYMANIDERFKIREKYHVITRDKIGEIRYSIIITIYIEKGFEN